MTVDEALELVEIVLNYQRLNKVQELVFRQSWEGRSYKQISGSSEYEYDYIKDAGAKLWKLLSEAFGEKVKKDNLQSVLKRYRKRNQVNLHRTQVIGVNFSGASLNESSLSGANLTVTKLLGSIYEGDFCQGNLYKTVIPDVQTELREENISSEKGHNQGVQSNSEEQIYHWNDLRFHSDAQIKIAEALDRAGVLFFPNSKARITTTEGRENQEPDFLIFHNGKWGILEVDGEVDEERDRILESHGIPIIQHYDATQCSDQPDLVVQEFLEMLSQI
jgi:Pentapeptide repeats (8 copies)